MRGEAPGPLKAQCPSVRECQAKEVGVRGLVSRGRENGIRGSRRRNMERDNI